MKVTAVIFITAVLLDLILGDFGSFHPLRMIGKLINRLEDILFRLKLSKLFGGFILLFSVILSALTVYFSIRYVFSFAGLYIAVYLWDICFLYYCIALKDLFNHIEPIITALKNNDLSAARQKLSMVVGRNVENLDEHGVSRAAIETLSENFTDSFLSPLFWFVSGVIGCAYFDLTTDTQAAAGVFLAVIFRITNTLDAMVGYKTGKYLLFGRPSARFDDILNFIPARISVLPVFVSSLISGLNSSGCVKTYLKDRLKHPSPNSAHPQSAVAGALNIRLGGPIVYKTGVSKSQWLGSGAPSANIRHVRQAMRLILLSAILSVIMGFGLLEYV